MTTRTKTTPKTKANSELVTGQTKFALTSQQKPVLKFLEQNVISVLHGAAGTGKDTIQLFKAITGLINKDFNEIIFMRSVVEVGAGIGFLPGDAHEKTAPYEKFFYDNLLKMIDKPTLDKLKPKIKFEHIGFIRGKTFDNSCVILSEAQNCTLHEIMTICTRMSSSSTLLINGDMLQSDIKNSGFNAFMDIINNMKGVGVMELGDEFQMRNPLIVELDKRYRNYLKNKK